VNVFQYLSVIVWILREGFPFRIRLVFFSLIYFFGVKPPPDRQHCCRTSQEAPSFLFYFMFYNQKIFILGLKPLSLVQWKRIYLRRERDNPQVVMFSYSWVLPIKCYSLSSEHHQRLSYYNRKWSQ
jgi:hypothetical protein